MAKERFIIDWDDNHMTVKAGNRSASFKKNSNGKWDHDSGENNAGDPPNDHIMVVHKQSPGCIYVKTGAGWKMV